MKVWEFLSTNTLGGLKMKICLIGAGKMGECFYTVLSKSRALLEAL